MELDSNQVPTEYNWEALPAQPNPTEPKPEGRGFETRWGEILNLPNPSGRIRSWGLLSF
jgi:hypothetical protein